MSGNGPPTGIRKYMKRTRRRPAAFRKIHAADGRTQASIPASRMSGFPGRSSKAARTYARRTIAAAIGLRRDTRNRSILPRATLDFDASGAKPQEPRSREGQPMTNRIFADLPLTNPDGLRRYNVVRSAHGGDGAHVGRPVGTGSRASTAPATAAKHRRDHG